MSRIPPQALGLCARDLGTDESELGVLSWHSEGTDHKSEIYFVGVRGTPRPRYVVKLDSGRYDASHEYESLKFAKGLLDRPDDPHVAGLGVVRPVAWQSDPDFLITQFEPGQLAQQAIDRVVLGWFRSRPFERAHEHTRRMARWIGEFRARGARAGGGIGPTAYFSELRARVDALNEVLDVRKETDRLLGCTDRYLGRISDDDIARMARQYPHRGDARPKNFLVGDDGTLYAFDMEGFGFGVMEHDVSCVHHALEYDGWRSPAAGRRASELWITFWDEYMQHGSSPSFVLLGYTFFLLERMRAFAMRAPSAGLSRRARTRAWLRNRIRWLSGLTGEISSDLAYVRRHV